MAWQKLDVDEINHKSVHGRSFPGQTGISPDLDGIVIAPGAAVIDPDSVSLEVRLPPQQALPSPLFIADFPLGSVSAPAKLALALGASLTGCAFVVGDGRPFLEEQEIYEKNGGIPFLKWTADRHGLDAGAFHGMAGAVIDLGVPEGEFLHPAADKHAAEVYGISKGPVPRRSGYEDLAGPDDLARHVELLREVTEHAVPVIVKVTAGRVYDDVAVAARAGADAVWVESMEHWRPGLPLVVQRSLGLPLIGLFAPARQAIQDANADGKMALLASGGIRNAADAFKCLALGADAVGFDSAALVALGCRQEPACATGKCAEGILTTDPVLAKALNAERAGKRLANFLHVTQEELRLFAATVGAKEISAIDAESLRAVSVEAATWTGLKLLGYDSPLPMWMH